MCIAWDAQLVTFARCRRLPPLLSTDRLKYLTKKSTRSARIHPDCAEIYVYKIFYHINTTPHTAAVEETSNQQSRLVIMMVVKDTIVRPYTMPMWQNQSRHRPKFIFRRQKQTKQEKSARNWTSTRRESNGKVAAALRPETSTTFSSLRSSSVLLSLLNSLEINVDNSMYISSFTSSASL